MRRSQALPHSLYLGSIGVSLQELTSVYCVFANGGKRVQPIFVTKIVDRDGKVLEENFPKSQPVISPATAYIMTSLMESVVQAGTGSRVRAIGRPCAGKTGTTDEFIDAWFMGFVPQLTSGVWVGFDDEKTIGAYETGAKAAVPIWLDYMTGAVKGMPIESFPIPEGVVFEPVDPETGDLTGDAEAGAGVIECFKSGSLPTNGSGEYGKPSEGSRFWKEDLGL